MSCIDIVSHLRESCSPVFPHISSLFTHVFLIDLNADVTLVTERPLKPVKQSFERIGTQKLVTLELKCSSKHTHKIFTRMSAALDVTSKYEPYVLFKQFLEPNI